MPISLSMYDSRKEDVLKSIEIRRTGCVLSNTNSEVRADFLMKRLNVKVYLQMLMDLQR